jgi:hypothetical protein
MSPENHELERRGIMVLSKTMYVAFALLQEQPKRNSK